MRHFLPTLIVPKKGTTLFKTANTPLTDTTTDNSVLATGQMGVFTRLAGSGNPIAVAPAASYAQSELTIFLRRNMAGDRSPLPVRPYEKSEVIKKTNQRITMNTLLGLDANAIARNDMYVVGDLSTATGESTKINSNDESSFELRVVSDNYNADKYLGSNEAVDRGYFMTPDWTTIPAITAMTAPQQVIAKRDWVVKSVVSDFNNNSKWTVAICLSDTAPAITGYVTLATLANTANIGNTYTIGYGADGRAITLTVNKDLCYTFKQAIANGLANTTAVIPYVSNPSATTVLSAPQLAAFTVGNNVALEAANRIMILGLTTQEAAFNYVTNTKSRIFVGLSAGFNATVSNVSRSNAYVGMTTGAYIKRNYFAEQNYNKFTGYGAYEFNALNIQYPNEILEDHYYDLITIEHYYEAITLNGILSNDCKQTVIALVNTTVGDANVNPGYTGTANPLLIDLVGTPAAGPYTTAYITVTTSSTTGLLTAWTLANGGIVTHQLSR